MAREPTPGLPWALKDKERRSPPRTILGRKKLDAVLSDAIDHASSEKKEFQGTKEQRAKLKQVFPDLALARR